MLIVVTCCIERLHPLRFFQNPNTMHRRNDKLKPFDRKRLNLKVLSPAIINRALALLYSTVKGDEEDLGQFHPSYLSVNADPSCVHHVYISSVDG